MAILIITGVLIVNNCEGLGKYCSRVYQSRYVSH